MSASEQAAARPPVDERTRVVSNGQVGPALYLMRLAAPGVAERTQAGQFANVQLPGMEAHILRRPFGIFDVDAEEGWIDLLYQVVGEGTRGLSRVAPGTDVQVTGPIGHGYAIPRGCSRALVVAGGAGAAPLYIHARDMLSRGIEVNVVLGAQTQAQLATRERFAALLGRDPHVATDDGSAGFAGFATGPAKELLDANAYDHVACCGPAPMMRAVAALAADAGVECQVSLEARMACGIGACLGCVADTTGGRRRVCVDGPVFDAREVVWA